LNGARSGAGECALISGKSSWENLGRYIAGDAVPLLSGSLLSISMLDLRACFGCSMDRDRMGDFARLLAAGSSTAATDGDENRIIVGGGNTVGLDSSAGVSGLRISNGEGCVDLCSSFTRT
jgi:hypothetical protein